MQFPLVTPIQPPFGDPPISAIDVRHVAIDLDTGIVTVSFGASGQVFAQHSTTFVVPPAQLNAFVANAKAAIAAAPNTPPMQ